MDSIELSGTYKTEYNVGDTLNLSGLVVTAKYTSGKTAEVTDYTTNPSLETKLTKDMTKVTVSYTENSITKSKDFAITVKSSSKKLTEEEWKAAFNRIDYMGNDSVAFNCKLHQKLVDPEEEEPKEIDEEITFSNTKWKRVEDEANDEADFGKIINHMNCKLAEDGDNLRYYIDEEDPLHPTIEFIYALEDSYNSTTFDEEKNIYTGTITTQSCGDITYEISFNDAKDINVFKGSYTVGEGMQMYSDFTFDKIGTQIEITDWPEDKIIDNIIASSGTGTKLTSKTIATMDPKKNYIFAFDLSQMKGLTSFDIDFISDGTIIKKDNLSSTKSFVLQPNHLVDRSVSESTHWNTDGTKLSYTSSDLNYNYLMIDFYPKQNITGTNVKLTVTAA